MSTTSGTAQEIREGDTPAGLQAPATDGRWPRIRQWAIRLAPALGAFGAAKLVGFAVFMYLLHWSKDFLHKQAVWGGGARPWDVVGSWDGWWYQDVAAHGYHPQSIAAVGGIEHISQNSVAFFPAYPAMIRVVMACTGLGTYGAGMLVAILGSFAAAAGIYMVAARLGGHRTGVIAAVIWAVFPGSGVEWAVYSDSMFVALSAWACYAVMTRHWVAAGILTCIAGLNRPTAGALIAAVGLTALIALIRRTDGWRPLAAILIAPWGLIGYLGWVGYRMGDMGGYFALQRGPWSHYFDFGQYTFETARDVMLGYAPKGANCPVPNMIAVMLLLALPCLVVLMLRMRPPLVLVVFTLLTIALVLPSFQLFPNLSRYLLPTFPLYIPLAMALRRLKLSSLIIVLGVVAAASGWYAGYALFELGIP
ncbi:glycosyltransferase family 39 protein [Kitasatospora kifunensis]|uniref:Glycosyltransferase RgtA/B/C/D-like domain-containing protein n=1 Tax=Kitasatospora kifunensis TaxID=58351 RepID=A0A7W7VXM4_KITKI|nr:glycosyltransferase family 39 protein [Kitasatospora kifunensis]MBB4925814.1 hypothetical protein [Kitasatospora kifunensis]